jgi:hypothetical protein
MGSEWNHSVHYILKETIHVRLLHLGFPRILGYLASYLFSAFWHGFFSGYYVVALGQTLLMYLDSYRVEHFSVLLEKFFGKRFRNAFDAVIVHVLNYWMAAPWDLFLAKYYWKFYMSMWFGPVLLFLVLDGIGYAVDKIGVRRNVKKDA